MLGFSRVFSVFAMAALLIGTTTAAFAEDVAESAGESKAKLENHSANKVDGDADADDVLTNNLLRAYSGSKSKWSMSNSINFDGGTLSSPVGLNRPNITQGSGNSVDTDLNDQLAVKYNLTAVDSILAGFGVRKVAPFVSSGPDQAWYASGGKDVDMYDPSVDYQRIYKFAGVQAVAQLSVTQFTRQDIVSSDVANGGDNLAQQYSFDQENIYEIGESHWSVGGSVGFAVQTPTDSSQDWSQYQVWVFPYVEYAFTEKINFRTVLNEWEWETYHVAGQTRDTVTQSIGIGFSVTRDLYVYPNVQFLPDNLRADATNVGVTTTLNLF